ncbi:MAG TPA: MFS transporter [Thermomicrobiales bacterium]|nr:MFS transporter [Thermomicrobiales bacterium]
MKAASASQSAVRVGWLSPQRRPLTAMISTNFISLFSNQLTAIAVPWFVLTLTGSATRTGLTAAATLLPSIVMTLLGGAIVDRTSARKMSIFSDLVSGITVALVPLLYLAGVLNFPLLLILMFLGAIFDAPGGTARGTMLPWLAERAGIPLERVNSIYGFNQALTALFGAAIAGVMVGVLGAVNVLWFNAAAFAVSALGMALLVPETGIHPPSGESLMADIRHGIGWLWRQTALRTIILAAVVLNGVFSPIAAVALPWFAKTEYDSAAALGLIMSGLGAGGLVGALAYGALGTRIARRSQVLISASLICLPISGLALLPPLWLTWLLLLVTGIGIGAVNPMVSTILLTESPPNMRGRVSGVFMAGATVASPLGVLLGGPMIAAFGLQRTFLTFGVILLVLLGSLIVSRSLAGLDTRDAAAEAT